ncbi:hypothetical protein HML84_19150 [Alcanivorax sp. IO_7]|nr:hypothetical protein HML84_19150 [Alcanivorax sp. IO_7]
MIRITTALLPLALLTGCQMFSYQEPAGADTATVTFTGDTSAQPAVCVPGKGFKDTQMALAVKPWETNAFDKLFQTMKKGEEVTVSVAASERARVGLVYNEARAAGGRDRCRVAAQFDARPGALPGPLHPHRHRQLRAGDPRRGWRARRCRADGLALPGLSPARGGAVKHRRAAPFRCIAPKRRIRPSPFSLFYLSHSPPLSNL